MDILTPSDVANLYHVVSGVQSEAKIACLIDGARFDGTMRGFRQNANGTGSAFGVDVRDLYLHVTLNGGGEVYWPVRDVVRALADAECAIRTPVAA